METHPLVHRKRTGSGLKMALTQPVVGGIAGIMMVVVATAYVLGGRGLLQPTLWMWLALWGAGCVAGAVFITIGDPEEKRRLLQESLADRLGLVRIRDVEARRMLQVAIEYRLDISRGENTAAVLAGGTLTETVSRVALWLEGIARLAHHVDESRTSALRQTMSIVDLRQRIDGLEARAAESSDARMAGQLRETIAGRRHQLRMAEEQSILNERAVLRLEQAVAALGSVATQLAIAAGKDRELAGVDTINLGIETEIEAIDHVLAAYDRAAG
jgi:hypothetical protein